MMNHKQSKTHNKENVKKNPLRRSDGDPEKHPHDKLQAKSWRYSLLTLKNIKPNLDKCTHTETYRSTSACRLVNKEYSTEVVEQAAFLSKVVTRTLKNA